MRYTEIQFPAMAFRPGKNLRPEVVVQNANATEEGLPDNDDYSQSTAFRYGVDLFNYGYFWEAHEVWEGIWKSFDRESSDAQFLQGLIQLSAACLKHLLGESEGVQLLLPQALAKLRKTCEEMGSPFRGLDLATLLDQLDRLSTIVGIQLVLD